MIAVNAGPSGPAFVAIPDSVNAAAGRTGASSMGAIATASGVVGDGRPVGADVPREPKTNGLRED